MTRSTTASTSTPPMPPPGVVGRGTPGRRERHKARTRRSLEEAALRLFARRGFDDTTIEDITDAADVSPRTFFRYFASKEDVLFADHAQQIQRFGNALSARSADEPVLASITEALLTLADDYEEKRERYLLRFRLLASFPGVAARGMELQAKIVDVVAGFVAERLGLDPSSDLRPVLVGQVTVGALAAATNIWSTGTSSRSLPELVRESLELTADGMGV
ncbi:MAG: TetR family transcriptional regulator [Acidimicrobiia bacterium]|nr:TetR family transcriptional regulator [Acidimicrobiia bacterium]